MKWTLTDFLDKMEDFHPDVRVSPASETVFEELRIFHEYYTDFSEHILYVCRGCDLPAELPVFFPQHLVCIGEDQAPAWLLHKVITSLIFLDEAAELDVVFSRIPYMNASETSDIQQDLFDALYYGQGLQKLTTLGEKLLGNALSIVGTDYSLIAASKDILSINAVTQTARPVLDQDAVRKIRSTDRLSMTVRSLEPIFYAAEAQMDGTPNAYPYKAQGFIDSAVRVHGVVVAYLTVAGIFRPVRPEDIALTDHLARLFSIEFQKSDFFTHRSDQQYESILLDILENQITDKLVIIMRMRLLDRSLGESLQAMTVRLKASKEARAMTSHVQTTLRSFFKNAMSVFYKGDIVLLVSTDGGESPYTDERGLLDFLKSSGLLMGVSNAFSDPSKMRRFYQQSVLAIEFGAKHEKKASVFHYKDFGIFHALSLCAEQVNLRDLCHPVIRQLNDSGDPADSELLYTLYQYLFLGEDTKKTAQVLHIHRNTMYYRLEKLKALLGDDLATGDGMAQLLLSFKIIEYFADNIVEETGDGVLSPFQEKYQLQGW